MNITVEKREGIMLIIHSSSVKSINDQSTSTANQKVIVLC